MQELYAIYAAQREKVSDVRAASAAAVFRACKERGCGRTIKEINKVLDPTVNMKKAISKADRDLKRTLQERVQVRPAPRHCCCAVSAAAALGAFSRPIHACLWWLCSMPQLHGAFML